MTVPVHLAAAHLYSHTAPGSRHQLAVVVTSFQGDTFYPMQVLSTDEMVVLQVEVVREGVGSVGGEEEQEVGVSEATLVTLEEVRVGHTAVFHVEVTLPPGASIVGLEVACPDTSTALPTTPYMEERGEEVALQHPPEHAEGVWGGVRVVYEALATSHISVEERVVRVVAGVVATAAGLGTCHLHVNSQSVLLTFTAAAESTGLAMGMEVGTSGGPVHAGGSVALEVEVEVPPGADQAIAITMSATSQVNPLHPPHPSPANLLHCSLLLEGVQGGGGGGERRPPLPHQPHHHLQHVHHQLLPVVSSLLI